MDAELLRTQLLQPAEGLGDLRPGHAVLGLSRVVHDLKALLALAQLEGAARIVAAEDVLRHTGYPVEEVHHRGVVEVDISAQLVGLLHILHGGLVGGEHDVAAAEAAHLTEHQLGQGGAVHAAALFLQDLEDDGVGQSLDREILAEALIPAEGFVDAAGVLPDAFLVVDVEGGGHVLNDVLSHRLSQKRFLFHDIHPSHIFLHSRMLCSQQFTA